MNDLLAIFSRDVNESLEREITEKELSSAILSFAKGKAPRYDEVPIEFFQQFWHLIIGYDFQQMLLRGMENGALHERVTEGLISLILKEGNTKDLNYRRPITFLTASYKIFPKTF